MLARERGGQAQCRQPDACKRAGTNLVPNQVGGSRRACRNQGLELPLLALAAIRMPSARSPSQNLGRKASRQTIGATASQATISQRGHSCQES